MIISGVTLNGTRVVDATIITNNLLIWLDADNTSSYSGTGTSVTDLSGNGYTHTLSSAGIYTVLNGVKCFDCTNTGQVVVNSTGPTLPTTGFTYIGWARMNTSTATWRTLWRSVASDHPLLIEVGTNNLGMFDNNGADFVSAGYSVAGLGNTWVQYAVTGTNSAQTFYINGQQVGTTAYGAGGNQHSNWGNWNNGQPFGYVANMFLYSTILTQEQIQQNYYALRDRFVDPEIVTSNLVAWYDPSSSASYPGTGTTIYNLASSSLNGTMSNITYTDPYFTYNGTSSTLSVADAAALEPGSGDWTVEAWVYFSTIAGSSRVILGKTNNGGGAEDWGYGLRTLATGATRFEVGNGTTSINSPTFTASTGQWYQIVGVWTNVASNSIALYVNGVSQGSNSHSFASVPNTTNPLYLGSYNGGEFSQWLNGRIGVVRIYNAALTAAQVLQNYNADRGTYGL